MDQRKEIKGPSQPSKQVKQDASIGIDQEEQVMNGNYGMAETKEEDEAH
ncbi:DUF4021 domain-containing protein [Pullulanibacillus sp. KACC 23026]|nr:DUF4021 domain-containing protein [Pullulanibacillus sp. KACC 23026]WEG12767.1 DUF4021 domain-containing protein [Pullulanibacillus sp. KACC 23026]